MQDETTPKEASNSESQQNAGASNSTPSPPSSTSKATDNEAANSENKTSQKNTEKKQTKKTPKKQVESSKGDAEHGNHVNKSESGEEGQPEEKAGSSARQPKRGRVRGRGRQKNTQTEPQQQIKIDAKKVAKRAWKIFLGEVNEEGLALIADKDARELAKKSIRVAEIFSIEEAHSLAKVTRQSSTKNSSEKPQSNKSDFEEVKDRAFSANATEKNTTAQESPISSPSNTSAAAKSGKTETATKPDEQN